MMTEPQKEHQWLEKLLGDWTYEIEEPGKPGEAVQGTESVRSLGGLWIVAEGKGEMPGCGPATTMMTLGYEPKTKRYLGTWVGSMMTDLWLYDGVLDETGTMLTLESEGPHMSVEGRTAKYRDVIEFKSADHRVLATQVQNDDGKWQRFMTTNYLRKK